MCMSGARVWSVIFVYIDVRDCMHQYRQQYQKTRTVQSKSLSQVSASAVVITQVGKMHDARQDRFRCQLVLAQLRLQLLVCLGESTILLGGSYVTFPSFFDTIDSPKVRCSFAQTSVDWRQLLLCVGYCYCSISCSANIKCSLVVFTFCVKQYCKVVLFINNNKTYFCFFVIIFLDFILVMALEET